MGVPAKKLFDVNVAYKIASNVAQKFDLVLISEHFEESMVLMADLLCWPIEFVAGIKHNVLPESKKVCSYNITIFSILNRLILYRFKFNIFLLYLKENLSDPKILEKWQAAEIKVYDEMYKKFQEKLEKFGRDKMSEEVKKLRNVQQNLEKTCDIKQLNVENQTKAEKLKYQYSAPYNKNGIHYIAGYVILH